MPLASLNNTRKVNLAIGTIVVLLVTGIITVFVRHRIALKNTVPPAPPENTEASLTIKNFHHMASEDGFKKWTLEASSASLYSRENKAVLNDLSIVFFMKDNRHLTLKANKGLLNSQTNDMTISGNIIAETSDYRLTTENLNYIHRSHIIQISEPVEIIGPMLALKADTMTYDINRATISCQGNVRGSLIEFHENMPDNGE